MNGRRALRQQILTLATQLRKGTSISTLVGMSCRLSLIAECALTCLIEHVGPRLTHPYLSLLHQRFKSDNVHSIIRYLKMHGSLLLISALSAVAKAHQTPLHITAEGPSFIQSSIFRNTDTTTSHHDSEPVFLPPTYRARGAEAEYTFQGLLTFAHLEYNECTSHKSNNTFDIAIVGHPFDLGVSYRPGARFGPNGAREGARRLSPAGGWE